MSIQMKTGLWRERNGKEAIVIDRMRPMPLDGVLFSWSGFDACGVPQMYTDNGTCQDSEHNQPHDLVAYIGPVGATEKKPTVEDTAAWLTRTLEKRRQESAAMN